MNIVRCSKEKCILRIRRRSDGLYAVLAIAAAASVVVRSATGFITASFAAYGMSKFGFDPFGIPSLALTSTGLIAGFVMPTICFYIILFMIFMVIVYILIKMVFGISGMFEKKNIE
jgi:hypothetical protein